MQSKTVSTHKRILKWMQLKPKPYPTFQFQGKGIHPQHSTNWGAILHRLLQTILILYFDDMTANIGKNKSYLCEAYHV